MDDTDNIKEKIAFYRGALGLLIGFLVVFIVGGGMMMNRWYQEDRSLTIKEDKESGLLRADFDQLGQELEQRTLSLEPKIEIMYGKDIGKLEPFQSQTQE